MSSEKDTRSLYNSTSGKWARREPNSLSDFTARPVVFDLCGDVSGSQIIDLGAGEGYCARELANRGAEKIVGVELSEKMVELAKEQQEANDNIIEYTCGTVTDLQFPDACFDLALGVFVYNYLHIDDLQQSLKEVYRVLRPAGKLIFSVPHPSFPFIKTTHEPPFYFDVGEAGYFSSRDSQCQGEIHCRDGTALNVQMIPKSLEDYFNALSGAGFTRMPLVRELAVTEDMLKLDETFFSPLVDVPLHLAFVIGK